MPTAFPSLRRLPTYLHLIKNMTFRHPINELTDNVVQTGKLDAARFRDPEIEGRKMKEVAHLFK